MAIVTDEMRSLIGMESEPRSSEPVSEELLRRFVHAVLEDDPVHWDPRRASESRYGEVVAPPLFPVFAFQRAPGTPDPFEAFAADPDDDGLFDMGRTPGLPLIDLPVKRVLNGGSEARFHRLARVGDVITARSKYVDISERQGGDDNPMVFIRTETTYTNQHDDLLVVVTQTVIRR
ncbi:MaoC family dehydratase N-terminal domain-containing protein [Blastococcus sp. URHD0036]|uniref:FAS1-like dehydratase domain-containing protein n=1 Tax=Blastococcus sp. URHD0036 TaxID=1380356 RepID=UPI00049587D3|nr:MaoC family dehydratase N-terminal domain-containing protein [Blastococcus sp. URHD0036]